MQKFFSPIPPLLLFILTPILVSLHVYFANMSEFSAPIASLLTFLLPFIGIVLLFLLFFFFLLPEKIKPYSVSLLAAIGVLFWIQGYLLNWDYGILTGVPIEWSEYPLRSITDILVWATVIACFLLFSKKLMAHLRFVSILLLVVQVFSLSVVYYNAPSPPALQAYTLSDSGKMRFSEEKNIVILMLDAFQADVFQEIIDKHPEYYDVFSGFTYFRNTTAQYSKTYGAVPAILTGHWYENDRPIERFLSEAFADAISAQLVLEGWTAHLYPMSPRVIGYSNKYASNIVQEINRRAIAGEAGKLLDIGFFRSSPQAVKSFWLNDFHWRLANYMPVFTSKAKRLKTDTTDRDFFHPIQEFVYESQNALTINNPAPTFKFFHFNIPHEPFTLNEKLEYERLPSNREGFYRYSISGLEAARLFLEELKSNGIYDNTMIFIVSDHGGGEYNTGIYNDETVGSCPGNAQIPTRHHQSGLPLLLAKPFSAEGRLKISDSPVSLGDVLPTISSAIGLEFDYPGYDIFSVPQDLDRDRRYLFYKFSGWNINYLPEMIEYEIDGHAWHPSSWIPTGRVFEPAGEEKESTASVSVFVPGEKYFFNNNDHVDVLVKGWSSPEDHGVWSNGKRSAIKIPLKGQLEYPIKLRFRLRPYTCGGTISSQFVKVTDAEGKSLEEWRISRGLDWYSVVIDESDTGDDALIIYFELPDAKSPVQCQTSLDSRVLGVSLNSLQIDETRIQ